MAQAITDSNFDEIVLKSEKPVMLDFWAEWCGPCRMIAPFVEQISQEFEGKAIVGKVDVDNNPEVAARFGIRNIPTIIFFKNGQVVDKHVGAAPKDTLASKLQAIL